MSYICPKNEKLWNVPSIVEMFQVLLYHSINVQSRTVWIFCIHPHVKDEKTVPLREIEERLYEHFIAAIHLYVK